MGLPEWQEDAGGTARPRATAAQFVAKAVGLAKEPKAGRLEGESHYLGGGGRSPVPRVLDRVGSGGAQPCALGQMRLDPLQQRPHGEEQATVQNGIIRQ